MPDLKMLELNKVFLAGRLTRDPQLAYTPNSLAICEFGIAVSRKRKDKGGNVQEDTYFAEIKCFDKAAEWVAENVEKGDPVFVEGRLSTESWEQKDGTKRSKTRVIADRVNTLAWKDSNTPSNTSRNTATTPTTVDAQPEDDLPF